MPGPEAQGVKPCLNGSLFYLPALGALIVVGLLLEEKRHRAAPYLLWAAAILAVSVTLRTLDMALCDRIVIEGRKIGTHFAWHVLNGLRSSFCSGRASKGGLMRCVPSRRRLLRQPRPTSEGAHTIVEAVPVVEPEPHAEEAELENASAEPLKLTERVASVDREAAKEGEAPAEDEGSKEEEPRRRCCRLKGMLHVLG